MQDFGKHLNDSRAQVSLILGFCIGQRWDQKYLHVQVGAGSDWYPPPGAGAGAAAPPCMAVATGDSPCACE